MIRSALVTGGGGFVGQWLARELLAQGYAVTCAGLHGPGEDAVLTAAEQRSVRWLTLDVRDSAALAEAVDAARPSHVFHLAGVSFVPAAEASSALAYDVNVVGTARLLEVLRARRRAGALDPLVLVVGSGEQYGRHERHELPLVESAEQRPLTVYAASKAAQELVAMQAHRAEGLRVIATRSFNHAGPGQAPHFLLPAVVRRVLALPATERGTLAMGNLSPVRDYLHVSDVVAAYRLLGERGVPGECYNVASGEGRSVRSMVEAVLQRVGVAADISTDPALVRPIDLPALVGSPAKLAAATGWAPRRTTDDLIDDLIRFQRSSRSLHAETH